MTLVYLLLGLCFAYGLAVSWLAYRQSGELWMLFLPHWVDKSSGISAGLRRHGMAAFALLLVAVLLLFIARP